jgi:ACS family D-galactonate transporter-like MFS transporter
VVLAGTPIEDLVPLPVKSDHSMTEPWALDRRASRTRYWVIAFAASLATITYIDRVAIAQAAPLISVELKLTPVRMGYILAAFGWSYALFEVPSG